MTEGRRMVTVVAAGSENCEENAVLAEGQSVNVQPGEPPVSDPDPYSPQHGSLVV